MKVGVLGGGPAGLYAALLLRKADPSNEVTVAERNAPDATFGWGVVFSEETLAAFRDADFESYTRIQDTFARWTAIDVFYRGERIRSRGHAFSGIRRTTLLGILQDRCRELGVTMRFNTDVATLDHFQECDLIVAADGVNGLVRARLPEAFRPSITMHGTRYVWFGADLALEAFTFIFRENEHGLFQVHAYPFDAHTSTFIVECGEPTWRRAGLDRVDEAASIAYCERLFAPELGGHRLMSNRSLWLSFPTLRCETWHTDRVVLVGDAAHTAHFSIGSGTKLAMEDAIALVDALRRYEDRQTALTMYEMERQPIIERFQDAARESSTYFEQVARYTGFQPVQFAFNLLTRSRRITHLNLTMRDPDFMRTVDAWYAAGSETGAPQVAASPAFTSARAGEVPLRNRLVLQAFDTDRAVRGGYDGELPPRLLQAAQSGAGMVLVGPVAASARGRVSSGSSGLYTPDHAARWQRRSAMLHEAGATMGILLSHAGRRGSTRPRDEGVDRPLRRGGWPIWAPSAIPYAPGGLMPHAMTEADLERTESEFLASARLARSAGVDLLLLDLAHGFLLASFLSPLTNRRADGYGGSLENRMRFPLSVFRAVRAEWPAARALGVRLLSEDRVSGGFTTDDAVQVARALSDAGCDVMWPAPGQTVAEEHPDYARLYGVPAADRIRNEAGIPVIAAGNLTTLDEANTVLAAGRADFCLLDLTLPG